MAYTKGDDVQPPYTGGLTPGRIALLTPGDFEVVSPVVYNWLERDLEGLSRKLRLLIELIVLWPLAAGFRLGPVVASRLYLATSSSTGEFQV